MTEAWCPWAPSIWTPGAARPWMNSWSVSEDPALLLGTAKDLLEAISKFVLEERGLLPPGHQKYHRLLTLSFDALDLQPGAVAEESTGRKQVQTIFQAAKTVALMIGDLRNQEGTGHGRTLPTGVSVEAAGFVIRQAVMVADLMLATHDRQMCAARA